jgi:hypothetical protein
MNQPLWRLELLRRHLMDETFKDALRAALHRWIDAAIDSDHGDLDLSRQEWPSGDDTWYLQLSWTSAGNDMPPAIALASQDRRRSDKGD